MNVGDLAIERHRGGGGEEIDRDQPGQAAHVAEGVPMVGSALARMVLSIEPMNSGSSTPKTTTRVSDG